MNWDFFLNALDFFNYMVLIYFLALNTIYLTMTFFAFRALRRYVFRLRALDIEELITSAGAPPITLIAPAYNEAETCVDAMQSLLQLKYPEYEILMVNDGSTDETMQRMLDAFDMVPASRFPISNLKTARIRNIYRSTNHHNLWLIDKDNGGKSDALNAGLNFCRSPLFCAMDSDCLLDREALIRIVRPFLEDSSTIAAGGIIRIINGCDVSSGVINEVRLPHGLLPSFQVLEYLRAFLSGRIGWDIMNATLIVSGAFGLFRRGLVVDAGGFSTRTVGEDMELIVRLHRYCLERKIPYRVRFIPDPIAWTECPETLSGLGKQRDRWHRGLVESLWIHRRMLANPKYGRIGMLAYPYFYLFEMVGPLLEFAGYLILALSIFFGVASPSFIIAFLFVAIIFGITNSIAAVALEEMCMHRYPRMSDLLRLFVLAVVENFGYRQLLTLWRVRGFISALFRVKSWGKIKRKGFGTKKSKVIS